MESIIIEEQGLRDGLQTLQNNFTIDQKLKWIHLLINAGVKRIQVGSFVNPKLVPSMADTDELFRKITKDKDINFSALVLNQKGVERAINVGIEHLSISLSASNTHSLKNTGKNIDEAKKEMSTMIALAKENGIKIRGGIQCAFGCRYEGKIKMYDVIELVDFLLKQDIDEIALADSTGMGQPRQVKELMNLIVKKAGNKLVGLHLHNTENKGYANLMAGLDAGVKLFDTAFGGLGGCPFIKGATGNIATEDVVHMLNQMDINTGIDLSKVALISAELETELGYKLPGLIYPMVANKEIKLI